MTLLWMSITKKTRHLLPASSFKHWQDSEPVKVLRIVLPAAREYHAGRFYERELPALLAVLQQADQEFETILIDGFVHLQVGKGLGAHLYEALQYPSSHRRGEEGAEDSGSLHSRTAW
jgi:deoxyinosine 3'endonuclease (endonuclease V)